MTEFIEEVKVKASGTQRLEYIVYFFLGALELILAARLILKLLGASVGSGFVQGIYTVSSIFVMPFEGIFRRAVADGLETASVLEPATIVAMIVYAIVVMGVVKFIHISSGEKLAE